MQSEPTTFEETIIEDHAPLPSLTFCVDLDQDNFTTFQDVMDAIELERSKSNTWFHTFGRNIDYELVDLKNPAMIGQTFNITFEDLWSFGATVSPFSGSHIIICSMLNFELFKLPAMGEEYYFSIDIKTCHDKNFGLRIERHEPYQSGYNHMFDMKKEYQYFRQGLSQYTLVTPVETESLKQRTHDCYEDNSMKMTDCIDEYIAEELNCSLPWTKPYSNLGVCSGTEELTNFRTIHSKITSKTTRFYLNRRGCLKPNCLQTKWKDSYVSLRPQDPNCTLIRIGQESDSHTIQRKEILLADFSTFVVDCGSYLGLFLGASILSLTDTALTYILKAGAAFFRK